MFFEPDEVCPVYSNSCPPVHHCSTLTTVMQTRISGSIDGATTVIFQFLEDIKDVDHLQSIPEYDFQEIIDDLSLNISSTKIDTKLPDQEGFNDDEAKAEAEKLNAMIELQTKNFIYQTAMDNAAVSLLEIVSQNPAPEPQLLTKLCKLLDLLVHLAPIATNAVFFRLISTIMDTLLSMSTESAEKMWDYVESRRALIEDVVFDNDRTGDRIALLELCNSLSDRFYDKTGKGMFDSYKEDTFNDHFKYRIRSFIANLLKLEDNTGLNKYFTAGNRMAPDMVTQKTREGNFVKDIIQINKMFRDPYYYLRPNNHSALSKNIDILNKVYQYLIDEETKYYRTAPKSDIFAIPTTPTDAERQNLTEKYNKKMYFPEHYWGSQFEELKKGASFEELKRKDQDYIYKLFDSTKTRQMWLLQIFIICSFFYELIPKNKREFLKEINAPANVKHISDDFIPERLLNILYKIKRDLTRVYRNIDTQFSYLVQTISHSESFWWGWLIYGKDTSGKPMFADRYLSQDDLTLTAEKLKDVILFRDKRYFNTFATPQLSRRMKVETGMLKLKTELVTVDHGDEISQLNEKIANGDTNAMEDRDILLWKHLKEARRDKWLSFGTMLTKDMFPIDEPKKEPDDNGEHIKEHQENTDGETNKRSRSEEIEEKSAKRLRSEEETQENQDQEDHNQENQSQENNSQENQNQESMEDIAEKDVEPEKLDEI